MTILIIAASKHGSTREIADAIGEELQQHGYPTKVYDAQQAPPANGSDIARALATVSV